ncbi:hypothetical protein [Ruegeria sp. HKCCD7255]|uniref:hypothetical protein n=1 Tax=Ruegeria sp. HKCCD7255 TaxID=2683004 RepID=UPI00148802A9|nr:hypothetical protein [Ruegeria sp. HKCCD7255]
MESELPALPILFRSVRCAVINPDPHRQSILRPDQVQQANSSIHPSHHTATAS